MAELRTKRWNDSKEPTDGTRIFIARYRPRFLRKCDETWDDWYKILAPSRELHAAWYGKHGQAQIGFDEYTARYLKEMDEQQDLIQKLARRYLEGETITFLCFCADASICHRMLLKQLVENAAEKLSG